MNPNTQLSLRGADVLKNGVKGVHEAFADYMLINPGCTLREMAGYFGYTVPWICTVINCDLFKAYFAERRNGISVAVAEDLPSKLAAAAHLATERMIEVIEKSEDGATLIDAFDKVLHRYGYAPNVKGGAQQGFVLNQQNNVFYLNRDELAQARAKLLASHSTPAIEEKVVNELPVPAT